MVTNGGQGYNWGRGIAAILESYKKENIFNFTQHSMYLLGIDCRPDDDSFVAVLTSENLLLNAYRQQFWGNPIFFAADASYKLTQEGNGVFSVITTNLAQQTKTIAYGVISHEHTTKGKDSYLRQLSLPWKNSLDIGKLMIFLSSIDNFYNQHYY